MMHRFPAHLRRWSPPLPGALVALVLLHLAALLADPLAPYRADQQRRDVPFAPPTRLHFVDAAGRWHLAPVVYALEPVPGHPGSYREDRTRLFPVRLFVPGAGYRLAGLLPGNLRLVGVDAPAGLFLLGTDRFGRDLFSRLILGARVSLFAGLVATAIALGLGVVIGAAAGFCGGKVEVGLMGATDIFLSLPWVYFLLAARSLLPLELPPAHAFFLTAGLIGLVGWARPARVVRGVVQIERGSEYVAAARSCGASGLRVLGRHVLPQATGPVLTQAAMLAPRYVLAEVTLSYLGLGVGEPIPTWGTLTAAMFPPSQLAVHWWLAAPLAAMVPVFVLYDRAARDLERLPSRFLRCANGEAR